MSISSTVPRQQRRPALRGLAAAMVVGAPLLIGSCQAVQPSALEGIGETVLQLGDAISALQIENALLQEQVDSLRIAVARQDTALRQFANLAGVPLP